MNKKTMVIGGGVAGIQAALDLAEMGIETVLIEKGPSIGGRMAQLDKTFPTNDCAMCILSPKLVEIGSHPYVTIISNAEVLALSGGPGNFKATVRKLPRYIDEEKCTGCGICASKCPTKIPDPFNKDLGMTTCISIPFPQAVPAIPIIHAKFCRYFTTGKCRVCEKVCQVKAIDFNQKETIVEIETAAVILACGTSEFDARLKGELGYKLFPNVMTSIEYERILSASGPTGGHIVRASDKKEPKKIAFLQCAGSRDMQVGNEHCSAICCMQAAKDAIITKEHDPACDITIFYMDIRAYGKGFDKFIDRAKNELGVKFINARVSSVEMPDPATGNLLIHYITDDGMVQAEEFDMLVISVGLEPSASSMEINRRVQVETDGRGFTKVDTFSPVNTSRVGIFACGSISGPKDIPESVMEASGAASAASALQGQLQKKQIMVDLPAETDIRGQAPRIGVFVCRCGINIASTVNVPDVVAYAARLPSVKHAQELLFACAQDSQKSIKNIIREKNLNRIVVSACTPRTHEPLFQKTLEESGLNPYLFEFANIREQCSWVHQKEPEMATLKAKELVRSAVSKVLLAEPLYKKSLEVNKDVLVIGGGLAGMTAALDLAAQGYTIYLLEKEGELGGNLRHCVTTLKGERVAPRLAELQAQVTSHPAIHCYMNAAIKDIKGFIGNFTTLLEPVTEIHHGVVIVATGADEYTPSEYCFGEDPRIITQRTLEENFLKEHKDTISSLKSVVMIQCVGSRDEERNYCSRVCCSQAIKNAITLKERNPECAVYILFQDIRTYGLKEEYYRWARDKNVIFIRYEKDEKPVVYTNDEGIWVNIRDRILNRHLTITPDLLVLSTAIVSKPENKVLSQFLKVPLNEDGFFLEAHVKLRPVDFATEGVFVCGLAHNPKDMSETIAQARAAAGRAATILNKDTIVAEGKVSFVRADRCSGCGACVKVCAYSAIEIDMNTQSAIVNEALCKGCGACAATCRSSAIDIRGWNNEQILAALEYI